jgi:hypothetical protein
MDLTSWVGEISEVTTLTTFLLLKVRKEFQLVNLSRTEGSVVVALVVDFSDCAPLYGFARKRRCECTVNGSTGKCTEQSRQLLGSIALKLGYTTCRDQEGQSWL